MSKLYTLGHYITIPSWWDPDARFKVPWWLQHVQKTEMHRTHQRCDSNPHANPHRPLPEAATYNLDFQPPTIYPPRCPTSNQSQNVPKWAFHVLKNDTLCVCVCVCVCVFSHSVVSDSLWPIDCSPPGFSTHWVFQARILEWVALFFSRRSSQPNDQTCVSYVSCIGRQILYHWTTWEAKLRLGRTK